MHVPEVRGAPVTGVVDEVAVAGTARSVASVLFADGRRPDPDVPVPDCFPDLNLDQVVDALLDGLEEYRLEAFFRSRLDDEGAICYRQAVFADLEQEPLFEAVSAFGATMRRMRHHLGLAQTLRHPWQRARWFADAVGVYCEGVAELARRLADGPVRAAGLRTIGEGLDGYVRSTAFTLLTADVRSVERALSGVEYTVHLDGSRVTVRRHGDEPDYSAEVARTFERFRRQAAPDHRSAFRDRPEMNHVETQVLDRVAQLYPEEFGELERFCERHRDFLDPTVATFDREVQFYLAYLRWTAPMREAGLPFCLPDVSRRAKGATVSTAFDLALAAKLVAAGGEVVANGVLLEGRERVLVVSGPNQGGKTTFARMFGQLHHLAALGCPVPGQAARLYLCDQVLTHFEREEDPDTAGGKLADDLSRIREVLHRATPDSVVVVNELFTSTTLDDATFLGRRVIERLTELDALGVYVTFVESLASLGPSTVSMVSTVLPDDPSRRTFRVVRRPADGRSYAVAIAEKYGVTGDQLRRRLGR